MSILAERLVIFRARLPVELIAAFDEACEEFHAGRMQAEIREEGGVDGRVVIFTDPASGGRVEFGLREEATCPGS